EIYERPYDQQQPVVCLDEKPITLHADVRAASAAAQGGEARRDKENERCGTANIFCAVEPKAGRHFTFATPDRSGFEFAQVAVRLALAYPAATTIHLGHGQSQQSYPEVAGGGVRSRNGRRSLGPLHGPLHPYPRQLAQSSGDRNRDLHAAMSREKAHSRPKIA